MIRFACSDCYEMFGVFQKALGLHISPVVSISAEQSIWKIWLVKMMHLIAVKAD